jgi:hypothetical protein
MKIKLLLKRKLGKNHQVFDITKMASGEKKPGENMSIAKKPHPLASLSFQDGPSCLCILK